MTIMLSICLGHYSVLSDPDLARHDHCDLQDDYKPKLDPENELPGLVPEEVPGDESQG